MIFSDHKHFFFTFETDTASELLLNEQGDVLRKTLRSVSVMLRNEYHASEFPDFVAQFVIQLLTHTSHAETLVSQFHRYLCLPNDCDIETFETCCALGESGSFSIDFTKSAAELPGYSRLKTEPAEWIRLTTALIDYLCFMTNSEIQAAYTASKHTLNSIRLTNFKTVRSIGTN